MANEVNKVSGGRKKSLRSKMMIRFGGLIFIAFFVVLVIARLVVVNYMNRALKEDFQEEFAVVASIFKDELTENVGEGPIRNVLDSLKSSKQRTDVLGLDSEMEFFGYVNGEFRTITGKENMTDSDIALIKDNIDRGNLDQMLTVTRSINGEDHQYRAYITKVELSNKLTNANLYAVMYVSTQDELAVLRQVTFVLAVILLGVYMITMIILFLMATGFTKPIHQLEQYANKLGKHSTVKPIEVKTGDEIEALAKSMNEMASDIRSFNEEQSRFLQNASHELKTPLMSIRGYAEGIMDGVMDNEEEALQTIVDESERLKTIVNELSLLSKLETKTKVLKKKPLNLRECIDDSIKRMAMIFEEKGIKIDLKLTAIENQMIKGDYDALIQVFINILSNGVRYARSTISIEGKSLDDRLIITITDDGNGIREKSIPHLFERFYKGNGGQTGLGLAIVKAIMESHHGLVDVYNSDHQGATFELVFKKSDAENS